MEFMIYLICLGAGLLFTLISAVAGQIFGHGGHVDGSGGHVEAGADFSDSPGISAFSPTVIASFVAAFGGLGIIFSQIEATKSPLLSAPLAMLGGFTIAAGLYRLLKRLFARANSSSESKVGTLVGLPATIITPIPENGVGEIAYVQGGTRYTAPARETSGAPIPMGRRVKIASIDGTQFYVSPS